MALIKIGHRGACGYEPENTLASFKKAMDLGVDMIELDVQLTSCNEIVVMHDKELERCTNGRGFIFYHTLSELKLLDAGNGEKIPTLEEVLDLVDKKAMVNIELKGKGTAKVVWPIVQNYIKNKGWKLDDFLFSSFTKKELKIIREFSVDARIGIIAYHRRMIPKDFINTIKPYSLNLKYSFISSRFMKIAKAENYRIFAFTVNKPDDIKKIRELGVDGIFSNFPDRL